MAAAPAVRAWAAANGHGTVRGKLPKQVISDWDTAHPDDPYETTPRPGFLSDEDMDDMFPDVTDEAPPQENRPRPIPKARKAASGGGGLRALFGGKPAAGAKKKKVPRVPVDTMLGSVWRGAAKLAAPLPPLHRTLRVQAPVAGLLLEDAVRDTALDTVLQPLARMAETGKTLNALLGPPVLVTAMCLHVQQRAAAGLEPSPIVMTFATEALRSSLMTWMDVAGPRFEEALAREKMFEAKYGGDVDLFIAWILSPPPATQEQAAAEEEMYRRAAGIVVDT